jgi:hypothetical protein
MNYGYGQPMMGGGMPTATVSGLDMNHDGIPDQLQGGGMGMGMQQPMMGGYGQPMMGGGMGMQPMMGGYGQPMGGMGGMGMGGMGMGGMGMNRPTDYNHNGIPDRQEGGLVGMMGRFLPDNNGDGIPDILEGGRRRY